MSDFELLISDNASTDATEEICRQFRARDPRIRYIRQKLNIGAPRNWNALVHEARGVYFKWSSASDLCSPMLLQRCVEMLEADGSAVLCCGRTAFVDQDDRNSGISDYDFDIRDSSPVTRLDKLIENLSLNSAQQGVIRTAALRNTTLDRLYPGGDIALMTELVLQGAFLLVDEVLLYRRQTPETFTTMADRLKVHRMSRPELETPLPLVLCRLYLDLAGSVATATLSPWQKVRAWKVVLEHAARDRARLWRDVASLLSSIGTSTAP